MSCEKKIYSDAEIRRLYERITKTLIEKHLTVTTMESCTCGQIISLLTDTEGSSAVVKGAYVTYSNEAKIMQGVPAAIIEQYGVYSKETAIAMAQACRRSYGSHIGIGVTGSLGNVDPNNQDSIPGHVRFALDIDGTVYVYERELAQWPTRYEYKMEIAGAVAEKLMEYLV